MSHTHLRELIAGIAEIVSTLVPNLSADAAMEEQAALVAVNDRGVDQSVLKRFCTWAVNTVRAGASSAAVQVVSSATTTLLTEAAKLASHLT